RRRLRGAGRDRGQSGLLRLFLHRHHVPDLRPWLPSGAVREDRAAEQQSGKVPGGLSVTNIARVRRKKGPALRLVRGGRGEIPFGSLRVTLSPPDAPIAAIVLEEDTWLVLSAEPEMKPPVGGMVRIMTDLQARVGGGSAAGGPRRRRGEGTSDPGPAASRRAARPAPGCPLCGVAG